MSFQDYQQGPYYQPPPPTSGAATTSLVLGILGLLVCSLICSPLAIIYGNKAKREIDASGGRIGGRGQAQAGIITGWIGIGLLILGIIAIVVFVIAAASIETSTY